MPFHVLNYFARCKCDIDLRGVLVSYDVAVFQWITSCSISIMNTRVLTLLRKYVKSLTTSVTIIKIFIENMPVLKAIKSLFKTHMIKRIVFSTSSAIYL